MRRALLVVSLLLGMMGGARCGTLARPGQVKHVVIVWLKQAENTGRFMALSKELVELPGVVDYSIGPALEDEQQTDRFHLGVVVTLEDRQSLREYLRHPRHREIIEKMRPLVARLATYDFITR
ncbi:MAG: Dabb family protein [Methylohalobius sp.]|nr:Dabb family protein [Methylohalobius sp.]